jgi:hypothetical protein
MELLHRETDAAFDARCVAALERVVSGSSASGTAARRDWPAELSEPAPAA